MRIRFSYVLDKRYSKLTRVRSGEIGRVFCSVI